MDDTRRFAPSAARNRDPILEVLRRHMPDAGLVLEIASGTGEHAIHFAQRLGPQLVFQTSDPDAEARSSIEAWVQEAGLPNVRPPLALDVTEPNWWRAHGLLDGTTTPSLTALLCINMIHIAPWQAAVGLMTGAGHLLASGGLVILYGPYKRGGVHTAPSNAAFDQDLRTRNPEWGIRDLEAVADLAVAHGFSPPVIEPMPANNLTVIFNRH
jgi:Protein of unknown function (DUF938)